MAGVYQLDILETEAELKQLLRKEKTGSGKERIQLLYLFKSQKAKAITQASEFLARHQASERLCKPIILYPALTLP